MRPVSEIIIHCSATPSGWRESEPVQSKVEAIRQWHVSENGWLDIGYHYIVDRDGAWLPARPVEMDGAHVKGHNSGTIGVCLIGGQNSTRTDAFADHYTPEQDKALRFLLRDLQRRFGKMTISGHNDYTRHKGCPGFTVSEWLRGGQKSLFQIIIEAIAALFGRKA